MKNIVALVLVAFMSTSVLANNVTEKYTGVVQDSNCVQIGQNESVVGGMVGGGLGAVGGALVGSFFGKTGTKIGSLVGGVGGAAYGASGNKVYNCTLLIQIGDSPVMVNKQSEEIITKGSTVTVVKLANNSWQAL